MKKILLLLFIIISINGLAQFPATQSQGTVNTRVINNGGFQAMKGLINGVFADTIAANADYIDFYNGAQIYTRSDRNFWLRDSVLNSWVRMAKFSDVGSGGLTWPDTTTIYNNLKWSRILNNESNSTTYSPVLYKDLTVDMNNKQLTFDLANGIFFNSNVNDWSINGGGFGNNYQSVISNGTNKTIEFSTGYSTTRRSTIKFYPDSVLFQFGGNGTARIDSLKDAANMTNRKVMVRNTLTGDWEQILKDSIGSVGGGDGIYAKSVIKSPATDSVRLEGENPNEFPPSANKYYGRNSANQPGYHDQLLADIAGAAHGDLLYIDTNGFYATGHVTIKTVPQTRGCVDSTLEFVVDSTLYSPVTGATTFTNSYIGGKAIYIFREEMFQYYGSGFTVSGNTVTFGTPLELHERVFIVLKDSSCLSSVALDPPPEDPPVDMDFDVVSSVTESPANQWNFTGGSAYAGNTLTKMTGNGYLQFEMPTDALVIGLDDNSSPDFYNGGASTVVWKYGFYVAAGTMYVVIDGQSTGTPINIGAVGSNTHIRMRRSGTTVVIEASVDGTTFSNTYTFTPTLSGDIFVKTHNVGGGSGILNNPKTLGFE